MATQYRPAVLEAAERIRVLKAYTDRTGFRTTRSQNAIIQEFEGTDLADVLRIAEQK